MGALSFYGLLLVIAIPLPIVMEWWGAERGWRVPFLVWVALCAVLVVGLAASPLAPAAGDPGVCR